MFQYRELTTGMFEMVRNFWMSSSDAVVPARRADATAAAGLKLRTSGDPALPFE